MMGDLRDNKRTLSVPLSLKTTAGRQSPLSEPSRLQSVKDNYSFFRKYEFLCKIAVK